MFINDLIHLKKTMNGSPSKFFQEKGTIKEPIPADPDTILGVLSGDFQELAQRGNGIIQEQIAYSKNRRKRQPKQMNLPLEQNQSAPAQTAPGPDLSQQLALPHVASAESELVKTASRFEDKYLSVEGSNKLTRFVTRMLNPRIGLTKASDLRRVRIALLNEVADSSNKIEEFRSLILKSSNNSIAVAQKKLDDVWNHWDSFTKSYIIYKGSSALELEDQGGTIENAVKKQNHHEENAENGNGEVPVFPPIEDTPVYKAEQYKKMVTDYKTNKHVFEQYINAPDLDGKANHFIANRGRVLDKDLPHEYHKSIIEVNKFLGTKGRTFAEIAKELKQKSRTHMKEQKTWPMIEPAPITPPMIVAPQPAPVAQPAVEVSPDTDRGTEVVPASFNDKEASYQVLEKVAQEFLKRWIGTGRHKLAPNKSSQMRIQCSDLAGNIFEDFDVIMNHVEKGLIPNELDPIVYDTNKRMVALRGLMRSLYRIYQQKEMLKKKKGK